MRFDGTSAYVATDDLKVAVNAAIALERPLLVKGEPGPGNEGEAEKDAGRKSHVAPLSRQGWIAPTISDFAAPCPSIPLTFMRSLRERAEMPGR